MTNTGASPARDHFELHLADAIAWVLGRVHASVDAAETGRLGFVAAHASTARPPAPEALTRWEAEHAGHLPLRALRDELGLEGDALRLLLVLGLAEEDALFGALCEALNLDGATARPTLALLARWWSPEAPDLRDLLWKLVDLGLVEAVASERPQAQWGLHVPPALWAALRGDRGAVRVDGVAEHPREALPSLDALVLTEGERREAEAATRMLAFSAASAVVVRGPRGNGRRTLLRAIARATGRSTLELDASRPQFETRWRLLGPLAVLRRALPVLCAEAAPGERVVVPELAAYVGPVGLVMGAEGSFEGAVAERALTLHRPMPAETARRALWARWLGDGAADEAAHYRLTAGAIRRAAESARVHAAMAGRRGAAADDVVAAYRRLPREALDVLAVRMPEAGDWSSLAVSRETRLDLLALEERCRYRELLAERGPFVVRNAGVRVLLQGPSGTGKTLAARVLASRLGRVLYRVDLASVVSKYIGETEKSLHRVFAHAEATDVVLLLDEGDALLGRRTAVQSSNDRYANIETNYLLQRLESFEGILLVTTNAPDHLDPAFQRRMDAVIDFRAPEHDERYALWALHLPPDHAVDDAYLREVASRCTFTGGQIRNIALHALLIAMKDGAAVGTDHLEAAVFRAYRMARTSCPLGRRTT